jgi:hypothetical protein
MAGSIRTLDGRQADLFKLGDYPLQAICRVCSEPVRSDGFLQPFAHLEDDETPLF